MDIDLNNEEIRILGCLIEKELATPEYYPLSLNALMNACNQKSNRNPIVSYNEEIVIQAIDTLKEKKIIWQSNISRVAKFEEHFLQDNNFITSEAAVICALLIRGPQTPDEIITRSERLFSFENLEDVIKTLENLSDRKFIVKMDRQPGQKEVRYSHLLGGLPEVENSQSPQQPIEAQQNQSDVSEHVIELAEKVEFLTTELENLKNSFSDFKKQFE